MARHYRDSSALVKRYLVERGTAWIDNLCDVRTGYAIYIVRVSGEESAVTLLGGRAAVP
jgi:hypothetical protein